MSPARPTSRIAATAALAIASLVATACWPWRGGSSTAASPAGAAKADVAPVPGGLTDANIAAVVVAANNADISYAQLALTRASDPKVRAFAQTMITDHTSVNRAAADLVAKLGVTPQDNETSLDLRDNAEEKVGELRELSGAAFDRAYIANEVAYHKTVLAAIDGALVPGARNAELKQLLVSVRPAVAAHLAHAEQLQASLGR